MKRKKKKSSTQRSIEYYALKRKLQMENPENFEYEEAEIKALNKELKKGWQIN